MKKVTRSRAKPERSKISVQIRLAGHIARELDSAAVESGRNRSDLIREAVGDWLRRQKEKP